MAKIAFLEVERSEIYPHDRFDYQYNDMLVPPSTPDSSFDLDTENTAIVDLVLGSPVLKKEEY